MRKLKKIIVNIYIIFIVIIALNISDKVYGGTNYDINTYDQLRPLLESGNDEIIYLGNDIGVNMTMAIPGGTKTIYGNGHTIINNITLGTDRHAINVHSGAKLILNNVKFNGNNKNSDASGNVGVAGICEATNCTFSNGGSQAFHVRAGGNATLSSCILNSSDIGVGVASGTVNINNCNIVANSQGAHNNGGTMYINGGDIQAGDYGVISFSNGNATINSGNIHGARHGVVNRGGIVYVKGGNIYSNTTTGVLTETGNTTYISGGQIYSNGIGVYNDVGGTTYISGGTIRNNTNSQAGGVYHNGAFCTITGGTFGTNPMQNVYLAADDKYIITNTSKPTFRVYPNRYSRGRKVVQTSSTSYPSQLIDTYVTLYPSTGWYLRAKNSDIVLWDKGTVTTTYKSEGGTTLKDPVSSTNWAEESYTTSAPSSIGLYDLKTTPSNASGSYTGSDITVNYVYEQARGQIKVRYVNKYTNEVISSTTKTGDIGSSYTATPTAPSGYTLESSTSVTRTYKTSSQTITFYCIKKSNVTIKYLDISHSNTKLTEDISSTLLHGDDYTSEEKTFEGYVLVKVPTNKTGTVGEANITVTYQYRKISPGIEVKYIDKFTGEEVADKVEVEGLVGEKYTPTPKTVENYEIVKSPSTTTFTDDKIILTYEYALVSRLTVSYVDLTNGGNKLTEDIVVNLKQGDNYTTSSKSFSGYTLVEEPESKTVAMGRENITVTYGYRKNSPGVEVKYIDKFEKNEIATKVTKTGVIGEEFTSEKKTIDGYIMVTKPDEETVTFGEEKITLVYEYVKGSTLTVSYVDLTYGNNKLTEDVVVELKQNETYEMDEKSFEGYTLVQKPENNIVTMGRTNINIIYGYKKNSLGVEVKYIDKFTGDEIEEKIERSGLVGDKFTSNAKPIENYELVKRPEQENITFGEEKITLTYEYALVSKLTVSYIDLTNGGNKLTEDIVVNLKQGDTYTTSAKVFNGYTLVEEPETKIITMEREDVAVRYAYKKNSPGVEVRYIDKYTGRELAEKVVKTGLVGDVFTAEEKEIEGYGIVTRPEEETVTFTEEKIILTYEYADEFNLIIKYKDIISGEYIIEDDVIVYKQGDSYRAEPKDISGYKLVSYPENQEGIFNGKDIEVEFGYKKIAGGVEIKFIDQVTKEEISEPVIKEGLEEDKYKTMPKEIEGYELVKSPENKEGEMTVEKIEVVYEYRKISYVKVKHLDENNGRVLYSQSSTKYLEGDTYTTNQENISGYTYTRVEGQATGIVGNKDIEVIYYYKKNTFVTVKYIDMITNDVLSEEKIEGLENDEYETNKKEIKGYEYIEVEGIANGKMSGEPREVIYKYKKQSKLITEHIDANTNEKITEDVVKTYKEGDTYEVLAQNIEGYIVVQEPESKTGIVGREDITKTFYYKKISGGLVVKYVDRITGEILEHKEYEGNEKDNIVLEEKTFLGYVLDERPEITNVVLGVEPKEVVYYYKKAVKIEVEGVDQNTGEQIYSTTVSGIEGDTYTTTPRILEGYELVKIPENTTGIFDRKEKTVVYEYRKIAGEVVVRYVNKETEEEIGSYKITGKIGDNYKAERKEIKKYEIVEVVGDEIGILGEEKREVVYYYERKIGKVKVIYEDEEGKEILKEEIKGKVEDEYKVEVKEIEGYKVVEVPENIEGKYKEEVIEIRIKLEKESEVKPIEDAKIIVKFVDEEGNIIREEYVEIGEEGETFNYKIPEIDGYKIIGEKKIKAKFEKGELVFEIIYEKILEKLPNTGDINVVINMSILILSIFIVKKYIFNFKHNRYNK